MHFHFKNPGQSKSRVVSFFLCSFNILHDLESQAGFQSPPFLWAFMEYCTGKPWWKCQNLRKNKSSKKVFRVVWGGFWHANKTVNVQIGRWKSICQKSYDVSHVMAVSVLSGSPQCVATFLVAQTITDMCWAIRRPKYCVVSLGLCGL